MKQLFTILLLLFSFITTTQAQNLQADTTKAHEYFKLADSLLIYQADYDQSIVYFKKAAEIYKKVEMWQKHFRSRLMVARNLRYLENFDDALKIAEKVKIESIKKLDYNNSEEAFAYFVKSEVIGFGFAELQGTGIINYKKSISYLKKSINILKSKKTKSRITLIKLYNTIAFMYSRVGKIDISIEYLEQAFELNKNNGKVLNHLEIANTFKGLGGAFFYKLNDEISLKHYKNAIKVLLKYLPPNHPEIAQLYENIGIVLQKLGEFNLALKYFKECLVIRKNIDSNPFFIADIYSSIGRLYYDKGNYDKSLSYFLKSNLLIKDSKNSHKFFSYLYIGKIYLKYNDFKNAIKYFDYSLGENTLKGKQNLIQRYFNIEVRHLWVLESIVLKAQTLTKLRSNKRLKSSLENYELADTLIDNIRNSQQNKSDQIVLGKTAKEVYKKAIALCFRLAKDASEPEKRQYLEKAFYFSEKSKAIVLYQGLAESNAKKFVGIPDSLLVKEKELKIEKNYLQQRILTKLDSQQKSVFNDRLFHVKREYEDLIASFETNYPKYYNLKHNPKIANVNDIQQGLDTQASLLEYFVGDSALYTFLLTKDYFKAYQTPLTDSLANNILEMNEYMKRKNNMEYSNMSLQLYDLLIKPYEKEIKGENLIIIPDGPLWYLSMDVLLTRKPEKYAFNHMNYLVEKYAINYEYSANLFLQEKHQKQTKKKKKCLAFSYSNENEEQSGKKISLETFRNSSLIDLPGSRKEIQAVSQIMDGVYYYGKEANEKNFKENASDYSILHLALHGTVDEKDPMKSRLYFTKPEEKAVNETNEEIDPLDLIEASSSSNKIEEDNYLYAYELYNMDLGADMVVLSACNTGSGKLQKGEGVMSLGRAFTYAGCKSMVISQWKLSDYSTPILIENFYNYLNQGETKAQSLRLAKIDYLKNTADNITANPYYWAGLVQMGNNDPIKHKIPTLWYFLTGVLFVSMIMFHVDYKRKI